MARRCAVCEKVPVTGNKISHSNIKTKKRHFPNLQKVRANMGGLNQRVYVCTRCLRSGKLLKPKVSTKTLRVSEIPKAGAAAAATA